MTTSDAEEENIVVVDESDPSPGRFDPVRFRNPIEDPNDPYPVTSPDDLAATRAELAELRRRMTRRTA